MKTAENILIIERVMQKKVPAQEVKVTITITELCRFIEAARTDEARKASKTSQYESFMDELKKAKGPSRRTAMDDLFGGRGFFSE